MGRPFLTENAKKALVDAVRTVERDSRAEIAVVVRFRSAPYREAGFAGALLAVFAALAFMLFSPWEFGLVWFLVDPALAGLLGGLAVHHTPPLTRLLTSSASREATVRNAARIAFLDRGITATREATGVLLYVSQLERASEVVADRGVGGALDPGEWDLAVEALRTAVRSGADGVRVADHLGDLGKLLAEALPAREDDVNEVPDEVVTS